MSRPLKEDIRRPIWGVEIDTRHGEPEFCSLGREIISQLGGQAHEYREVQPGVWMCGTYYFRLPSYLGEVEKVWEQSTENCRLWSGGRVLIMKADAGEVIFGREKGIQVATDHDGGYEFVDSAISGRHMSLRVEADDSLWVKDLGSRNGTWVIDGDTREKINAGNVQVMPGDVIAIGKKNGVHLVYLGHHDGQHYLVKMRLEW